MLVSTTPQRSRRREGCASMKRWIVSILSLVVGLGMRDADATAPHPVLGGTLAAWESAWGMPLSVVAPWSGALSWRACSGQQDVARYAASLTNGVMTMIGNINCGVYAGFKTGAAANAATLADARPFFPADAVLRGQNDEARIEAGLNPLHLGRHLLFYSASLSRTQGTAGWDCSGHPVLPGFFTYDASGMVGWWFLTVGNC
jgi:hypothetical protein